MVERDLEEINGHFDCHRGEINRIKEREKEARGLIIGAAHEAELFKIHLDRMEDNICTCGCTPSVVGEDFLSFKEEARTELSYASARGSEYVAPPMENPIPIPIPAPCFPGSATVLPPLEEITEEPTGAICDNLDTLLREANCQEIGLVALMFFLNFYFLMFLLQFPSMFPLLTYSQSLFSLSADYPRHSRQRRSKI